MKPPTSLLRGARLLALILQLALPSLGVIVDARGEAEAAAALVHVESQEHDCERGHPEHCALCQFLRAPVVVASAVHEPTVGGSRHASAADGPVTTGAQERLPSLPRGPPHLS